MKSRVNIFLPEHWLSSLTQTKDLRISGDDRYTLVDSRPDVLGFFFFTGKKQAAEHLRTTFLSVLLLKACCFFLSHFGTQPPSDSLRLSLFHSCRLGPTHSHVPQLYNILHAHIKSL